MKLFLFGSLLAPLALSAWCPCPHCPDRAGAFYNDQESSYFHDQNRFFSDRDSAEEMRGQEYAQVRGDRFVTERDEDLLLSIRDRLNDRNLTTVGPQIAIFVDHGVVTLRGSRLENEREKQALVEALRQVEGVRDIRFHDLQRGWQNQDMRRDIRDRSIENRDYRGDIRGDWKDSSYGRNHTNPLAQADRPAFRDRMGTQTQGRSFSQDRPLTQDRSLAQDRLNQRDPASAVGTNDDTLKTKVVDKLINVWFGKKYPEVQVNVQNGTVFLRGTVESQSDLAEIEKRIKGISEIRDIRNEIQVKEGPQGEHGDRPGSMGGSSTDHRSAPSSRSNY